MSRVIALIVTGFAMLLGLAPTASAVPVDDLQWSVDQFAIESGLRPAHVVYIGTGGVVQSGCGSVSSEGSLIFCPSDGQVYIGDDANNWINQFHPLGHAFAKAHEWGHSIQHDAGATDYIQTSEDGADCVAGAWMAWANKKGHIHLDATDLPNLYLLMNALGRQYPGDIHGTTIDRSAASIIGFTGGLEVCGKVYLPIR